MSTASAVMLALWFLFGLAAGVCHFVLLRWNTTLYLTGGTVRALAVQTLRMAATTALLAFAAWHGVLALLAVAIGVLLARMLVLRVTAVAP